MKTKSAPIKISYEDGTLTTYLYGKIKESVNMPLEEVLLKLEEWIEFEEYSISSYGGGTLDIEIG